MDKNLDRALSETFKNEGGYVNNPNDHGGATNMGITISTLSKWRKKQVSEQDVKNLTKDEASQIYTEWYWKPAGSPVLPSGLDYAVFDFGVMSGPSTAVKHLQGIVSVDRDGKVGNVTLAAIADYELGLPALIQNYQKDRLAYYKTLDSWPAFSKGWTNRVNAVSAVVLELLGESDQASDNTASEKDANEKDKPFDWLNFIIDIFFTILGRR